MGIHSQRFLIDGVFLLLAGSVVEPVPYLDRGVWIVRLSGFQFL